MSVSVLYTVTNEPQPIFQFLENFRFLVFGFFLIFDSLKTSEKFQSNRFLLSLNCENLLCKTLTKFGWDPDFMDQVGKHHQSSQEDSTGISYCISLFSRILSISMEKSFFLPSSKILNYAFISNRCSLVNDRSLKCSKYLPERQKILQSKC